MPKISLKVSNMAPLMHGRFDRINSRNDGERRAESQRSIIRYRPVRSVPPSERYSVLVERSNSVPTGEPCSHCRLLVVPPHPRAPLELLPAPRRVEENSASGGGGLASGLHGSLSGPPVPRWVVCRMRRRASILFVAARWGWGWGRGAHILSVRPSFTLQLARKCPSIVRTSATRGRSTHVRSASSRRDRTARRWNGICGAIGGGRHSRCDLHLHYHYYFFLGHPKFNRRHFYSTTQSGRKFGFFDRCPRDCSWSPWPAREGVSLESERTADVVQMMAVCPWTADGRTS